MEKEFKLIRIDDRLLHAQIILIWLNSMNINTIILVDNDISQNPFLSSVYKLAAPKSIRIETFTEDEMVQYYKESSDEKSIFKRTMVIMKELNTAMNLYKKGIDFAKIQYGGSGINISKKEETRIIKENSMKLLKDFEKLGILVYYQKTPKDKKEKLNEPEKYKG